jgi:hypothetical protein
MVLLIFEQPEQLGFLVVFQIKFKQLLEIPHVLLPALTQETHERLVEFQ